MVLWEAVSLVSTLMHEVLVRNKLDKKHYVGLFMGEKSSKIMDDSSNGSNLTKCVSTICTQCACLYSLLLFELSLASEF